MHDVPKQVMNVLSGQVIAGPQQGCPVAPQGSASSEPSARPVSAAPPSRVLALTPLPLSALFTRMLLLAPLPLGTQPPLFGMHAFMTQQQL